MISFPPQVIVGYRKDGRPIRVIAGGDKTAPASPSPSAQASVNDYLSQIQGALGGSSGTDLYGLGQWKDQPIDPSGFPPQVVLLLQQAGINTAQQMTAAQLAAAIAKSGSPTLISTIQNMLFYAGAYGSAKTLNEATQVGIFGPSDTKALTNTIIAAGQSGAPYGTYLTASANYGKANGILANITGAGQNPIGQASRADTDPVLRAAADSLFGHDPTPDEYARFQAFYNQKILQEARAQTEPSADQNLPSPYAYGQAITDTPGGEFSKPPTVQSPGGNVSANAAERDVQIQQSDLNNQFAQDQQVLGQVNGAASALDSGNVPTQPLIAAASSQGLNNAAEAFLRQDNPAAIGQQNVATKYRTLLSILGGA